MPVANDIEVLVFQSVTTQTGDGLEKSVSDGSGTHVERYPTSKLSDPLPEPEPKSATNDDVPPGALIDGTTGATDDDVPSGALTDGTLPLKDVSVQGDSILPDTDGAGPVVAQLTGATGRAISDGLSGLRKVVRLHYLRLCPVSFRGVGKLNLIS